MICCLQNNIWTLHLSALANCPNQSFNSGSKHPAFNQPSLTNVWMDMRSDNSCEKRSSQLLKKILYIQKREKTHKNNSQAVSAAHFLGLLLRVDQLLLFLFTSCLFFLCVRLCVFNIYSIYSHSWHYSLAWENTLRLFVLYSAVFL